MSASFILKSLSETEKKRIVTVAGVSVVVIFEPAKERARRVTHRQMYRVNRFGDCLDFSLLPQIATDVLCMVQITHVRKRKLWRLF
jgi:hypothetical protein